MKVSISLRGDNSDEYHIRLESWDRGNLPDEIIPLLEDADIIDVVLERVSGLERTSMHVLSGISEVIAKVFIDNSNAILKPYREAYYTYSFSQPTAEKITWVGAYPGQEGRVEL